MIESLLFLFFHHDNVLTSSIEGSSSPQATPTLQHLLRRAQSRCCLGATSVYTRRVDVFPVCLSRGSIHNSIKGRGTAKRRKGGGGGRRRIQEGGPGKPLSWAPLVSRRPSGSPSLLLLLLLLLLFLQQTTVSPHCPRSNSGRHLALEEEDEPPVFWPAPNTKFTAANIP